MRKSAKKGKGKKSDTPLLEQYKRIKAQHPEEILLFHLGDFYETFYEDAEKVSKVLGIVLTARPMGKGIRVPMAGIPVRAAETYINRLLKAGYKVAICDQTDEKEGRTLLKRVVTEVITPGTVLSEGILPEDTNNYLVAYVSALSEGAAAMVDLSTGDVLYIHGDEREVKDELGRLNVAELILPRGYSPPLEIKAITERDRDVFTSQRGAELLREVYGEVPEVPPIVMSAFGALLSYLKEKRPNAIAHLQRPVRYDTGRYIPLDERTSETLDLFGERSLYALLNRCRTPMGKRLLRFSISHPYRRRQDILERQRRVETFFNNRTLAMEIGRLLADVRDLERDTARASSGKLSPRNLLRLARSLMGATAAASKMKAMPPENLATLRKLAEYITDSLVDEPPTDLSSGGIIRDGIDATLDDLRRIQREGSELLKALEEKERKRTGIQSLKVGYVSAFGYYYEVPRSQRRKVPEDFVPIQSLKNSERYKTAELQDLEMRILSAKDRAISLERELYRGILRRVVAHSHLIKALSGIVAEMDVALALSDVANDYDYVKPEIHTGYALEIEGGRHPMVEAFLDRAFVPNDTSLDEGRFFALITGPNMGGKSTYLRQVGLIVLMAHMGGFVPANRARIPLTDRIFTRIGASDDLSRGISTFMAEMNEVSHILRHATRRSLLLLDEIGRGTSTHDGLAIAWAVSEYILSKIGAKTLFATHYHELSRLASDDPRAFNLKAAVKEEEGEVIFLYRIVPGSADRSYGLYVARLAGLPDMVIERAEELQRRFEREFLLRTSGNGGDVEEFLRSLNVDSLSPREALDILYELKRRVEGS
ncbi:MAG: DNA mismatch repair protein MutS [Thermotogae bacterium]|nr:DNA mismatch repair protein MutS [Thermotogota bacterium]